MRSIGGAVVLVTGANRGLGRALVDALAERGAAKVYAASRSGARVTERSVPVRLDVTRAEDLAALPAQVPDVHVVINNAGSLVSYGVLADDDALRRDLEVNLFGALSVTRALLPALEHNRPSVVCNVLSVASLAAMPSIGGYSTSKAAAWSLTQALRAELAPRGVRVQAVFPGPIDTDMIRAFPMAKTPASAVADAVLDGLQAGVDDVFPDPMSAEVGALWRRDPEAVARQFAG